MGKRRNMDQRQAVLAVVRAELDRVLVALMALRTSNDNNNKTTTMMWSQLDAITRDEIGRRTTANYAEIGRLEDTRRMLERLLADQERAFEQTTKSDYEEKIA